MSVRRNVLHSSVYRGFLAIVCFCLCVRVCILTCMCADVLVSARACVCTRACLCLYVCVTGRFKDASLTCQACLNKAVYKNNNRWLRPTDSPSVRRIIHATFQFSRVYGLACTVHSPSPSAVCSIVLHAFPHLLHSTSNTAAACSWLRLPCMQCMHAELPILLWNSKYFSRDGATFHVTLSMFFSSASIFF